MGAVRLREDAGIPLGNFSAAARRKARSEFRDSQRPACLARSAGRIPVDTAARDRDTGRYRAGFGGTAAHVGVIVSFDVRPAKYFSSERGRRAAPLGDGVLAASLFRARWARGSGIAARTAVRRHR